MFKKKCKKCKEYVNRMGTHKCFLIVMYVLCFVFFAVGFTLIRCNPPLIARADKYLVPLINAKLLDKGVGIAVSIGCVLAVLEGYKSMSVRLTNKKFKKFYIACPWILGAMIVVGGVLRIEGIGNTSAVQFACYVLATLVLVVIGLVEKLGYLE